MAIPVPHAKCQKNAFEWNNWPYPASFDHNCDTAAPTAAILLHDELNVHAKLFMGNVNRKKCDLNRPACRKQPIRREIDHWVAKQLKRKKYVWVLDVHSYPPVGRYRRYDMYILYISGSTASYSMSRYISFFWGLDKFIFFLTQRHGRLFE